VRADASDGVDVALLFVGVGGLVNASFTIYDGVLVGEDAHPELAIALLEISTAAPQVALFSLGGSAMIPEEALSDTDGPVMLALAGLASWSNAMLTHGIWAVSDEHVRPGELFAASTFVGINAALTLPTMVRAADGRMAPPVVALGQMIAATPGAVAGVHQARVGDGPSGGWIALGAWSGALVLHGAASLIVNANQTLDDITTDKPATASGTPRDLMLAPTLVPTPFDPSKRSPALALTGRF